MEDFKSLQPSHTNTSYLCTKLEGAHISLPHQLISWKEKELQEKWALCVCMLRGKQEAALGNLQEVFSIHKVHQFNRIHYLLVIIRTLTNPIEFFFCNKWNLFRLSYTEKSKLPLARCTENTAEF